MPPPVLRPGPRSIALASLRPWLRWGSPRHQAPPSPCGSRPIRVTIAWRDSRAPRYRAAARRAGQSASARPAARMASKANWRPTDFRAPKRAMRPTVGPPFYDSTPRALGPAARVRSGRARATTPGVAARARRPGLSAAAPAGARYSQAKGRGRVCLIASSCDGVRRILAARIRSRIRGSPNFFPAFVCFQQTGKNRLPHGP